MIGNKSTDVERQPVRNAQWGVVCLCAAWCGVCRQYSTELQALQTAYPQVHFEWVDVEDQEDLVGDFDVETFPTLLIGHGERAVFFGPLLPQITVLERLLQSLMQSPPAPAALPSEIHALWQRVAAQWQ